MQPGRTSSILTRSCWRRRRTEPALRSPHTAGHRSAERRRRAHQSGRLDEAFDVSTWFAMFSKPFSFMMVLLACLQIPGRNASSSVRHQPSFQTKAPGALQLVHEHVKSACAAARRRRYFATGARAAVPRCRCRRADGLGRTPAARYTSARSGASWQQLHEARLRAMLPTKRAPAFGGAKRYGTHEVVGRRPRRDLLVPLHDDGAAPVLCSILSCARRRARDARPGVLVLGSGFEFGPGCCFAPAGRPTRSSAQYASMR